MTRTDISAVMKSAPVTNKGMRLFKIVVDAVRLAKTGYIGVGAFGWRLVSNLGKSVFF